MAESTATNQLLTARAVPSPAQKPATLARLSYFIAVFLHQKKKRIMTKRGFCQECLILFLRKYLLLKMVQENPCFGGGFLVLYLPQYLAGLQVTYSNICR